MCYKFRLRNLKVLTQIFEQKFIRDFNPLSGKNDATAQYYLGLLLANSDKLDQKNVLVIFLKMVSNNVWQKSVKERNLIQSKA